MRRITNVGLCLSPVLRTAIIGLWAACALSFVTCAQQSHSQTIDFGERIVNADREPQNWLSTGRNYQETRFSPLDQIGEKTISRLGLSWFHDVDSEGLEATPIVVDGTLFISTGWGKVQAYEALTGKLLWEYDSQVPRATRAKACCGPVNRGVAYWSGKVFVGALDGRLIAVDAKTGAPVWSVVTVDQNENYTITGAPRIVKGRVIIGNGGADMGTRGYVSAYDAETGKLDWRFYLVPGEPGKPDGVASDKILAKLAANTWSGDWWSEKGGHGGGNAWDSMAYDPATDLLFIGAGNAGVFNARYRNPDNLDNLFVSSIVAVRPETGEYVWHYQTTPNDQWDYTATQHMIIADLPIDGVVRNVIMQAPKNGIFYVLDRKTGELISAKPYAPINWATGVDLKTGRPSINPEALYNKTGKTFLALPGGGGAHDWYPMSFSPRTGLVYIPVHKLPSPYRDDPDYKPTPIGMRLGVNLSLWNAAYDGPQQALMPKPGDNYLLAWDPVHQKEVWRAPHPFAFNGGVLSTQGDLVFQGDIDGVLHAYRADTGQELWSYNTGVAIFAAPVTYAVNGRQYVTVLSGWGTTTSLVLGRYSWGKDGVRGGPTRILTFALDAKTALPQAVRPAKQALNPPPQFGTPTMIIDGEKFYARSCMACHGGAAYSAGAVPDLRYSAALADESLWMSIVYDGVLRDAGMVSFKKNYQQGELSAIRAYIIDRAYKSKAVE
jgi:quinohemoprotein ethanol dehydrogenase